MVQRLYAPAGIASPIITSWSTAISVAEFAPVRQT
jgi:hypothetical protein